MWTRAFRALSSEVRLAAALPDDLAEILAGITATYEASVCSAPDLDYELSGKFLCCNGARVGFVEEPIDLPAVFERDLYEQLYLRSPRGWMLHAAALDLGAGAVLVAGPSGAGKSTLACALVARGARYLTDECALLDEKGRVSGLCRPLCPMSLPDPRHVRGLEAIRYPLRHETGELRFVPLFVPPAERLCHESRPLRAIVLLGSESRQLSPAEALAALWPHTLRADEQGMLVASALLSRCRVLQVVRSAVEGTCEAIASC